MSNPVPTWQPNNDKIKSMQSEVDDVVGIMRSNVEKMIERDEKLTELDQRANYLNDSAGKFQTTAKKVKQKFWWQNLKMTLLLVGVCVMIIIIIIVFTVGIPSSNSGGALEVVKDIVSDRVTEKSPEAN